MLMTARTARRNNLINYVLPLIKIQRIRRKRKFNARFVRYHHVHETVAVGVGLQFFAPELSERAKKAWRAGLGLGWSKSPKEISQLETNAQW